MHYCFPKVMGAKTGHWGTSRPVDSSSSAPLLKDYTHTVDKSPQFGVTYALTF